VLFIDYDLMMHAVLALCSSRSEGLGRPARVMMMVRPIQQDDKSYAMYLEGAGSQLSE